MYLLVFYLGGILICLSGYLVLFVEIKLWAKHIFKKDYKVKVHNSTRKEWKKVCLYFTIVPILNYGWGICIWFSNRVRQIVKEAIWENYRENYCER